MYVEVTTTLEFLSTYGLDTQNYHSPMVHLAPDSAIELWRAGFFAVGHFTVKKNVSLG